MFERLKDLVNADEALVRRGGSVSATMLLEAGNEGSIVEIDRGAILAVKPDPLLMSNWTFALRAPREAWDKFFLPRPPPGFTDIFALQKGKFLRIEGNLHPLMTHLFYFKDVLAKLRPREVA